MEEHAVSKTQELTLSSQKCVKKYVKILFDMGIVP